MRSLEFAILWWKFRLKVSFQKVFVMTRPYAKYGQVVDSRYIREDCGLLLTANPLAGCANKRHAENVKRARERNLVRYYENEEFNRRLKKYSAYYTESHIILESAVISLIPEIEVEYAESADHGLFVAPRCSRVGRHAGRLSAYIAPSSIHANYTI